VIKACWVVRSELKNPIQFFSKTIKKISGIDAESQSSCAREVVKKSFSFEFVIVSGKNIKMNFLVSVADLPTDELEDQLAELKARQKVIENELKLRRKKNADIVADCGLTLQEIRRFARHLLLPEFGVSGQVRLSKTCRGVLVVGAGGLGCPALQFLASSGVRRLGIVDHDTGKNGIINRQINRKNSLFKFYRRIIK
jgi:hypothetical protein